MPAFIAFARAACCTTFALTLAAACGGHSSSNSPDRPNDAGSSSVAGNRSSVAGNRSSGGQAHAGSGANTAGGGVGGAPFMSACAGPSEYSADGAFCLAALPRWTHDASTGLCRPIYYSGCGATENNYLTLEDCQRACPGGSPNYDACKLPSDCVLVSAGCCGVCDGPELSKHDFVAYNTEHAAQAPNCANAIVACGACPEPDGTGARKYLIPNCVNHECVVEDIRESNVTACTTSDDCRLRNGTACCEACDAGSVVAVRNDGSLEKLVCGEIFPPCLDCEQPLPPGTRATCAAGHCEAVYILQ